MTADLQRWDKRYASGDLPWDTGRHDGSLERIIARHSVQPCRVLELGCGTGSNAIWLAERGFEVSAVDVSPLAVARARSKAQHANVEVDFVESDVFEGAFPPAAFGFVFDRGCFHSFPEPEERDRFAQYVHDHLQPGGLWLSLIGSKDSPPREEGPPKLSAAEVLSHVEPLFEVVLLDAIHFDSDQRAPAAAWACLLRKRNLGAL
jgi:methyl halide transferase